MIGGPASGGKCNADRNEAVFAQRHSICRLRRCLRYSGDLHQARAGERAGSSISMLQDFGVGRFCIPVLEFAKKICLDAVGWGDVCYNSEANREQGVEDRAVRVNLLLY